jgi:peptide/nickel transport system permease protein
MAIFIARRVATACALLLAISFIVFGLLTLAPGSPEAALLGHRPRDPAVVAHIRQSYHLDRSFIVQYGYWLGDAAHLRFGRSIVTSQPVESLIANRAPVSIFLGLYAFTGTMIVGVLAGVFAALKNKSFIGRGISAAAFVGMCVPSFAIAVLLLYVFAVTFAWFPPFGAGAGFTDRMWHLTLPAVAVIIGSAAYVVQFTRTGMVTSLGADYVAFARARGLSRRRVLFGHALRNALIPIVTTGGATLSFLLIGAVMVETAFALPGLGTLLAESIKSKDIPVVQGLTLLMSSVVIGGNLLTDIAYLMIDPRIRYGASDL